MSLRDAFGLALRNLRQSKLRTTLTVLGVAIGIASLAGMVSLGVGLQDQFVGRFMQSGMFDSITVMSGNIQLNGPFGGGRGRGGRGGRGARPVDDDTPVKPLDDAALTELRTLAHVKDVYPMIRVPVELKFGETTEYAQAGGIPMSAKGTGPFQTFVHGEFLTGDNDAVCMLSLPFANRLVESNPEQLIGKEVILGYASAAATPVVTPTLPGFPPVTQVQRIEVRYRVVGIVERETGPMAMGGSMVSGLMIPLARARDINAQVAAAQRSMMRGRSAAEGLFQTVTVKVAAPQHTQDVQEQIKKLGYSAFSLNDALQGAKRAFLILDIILGLIGSIALAVASLGIMNTMVMSILERTREIGIMKAIGGSDSDVRRISTLR